MNLEVGFEVSVWCTQHHYQSCFSLSIYPALGSLLAHIQSVRVQNGSHQWARLGRPPPPLTECHLSLELMQTQHSFREYLLKHQMQAFRVAFNNRKTKGWKGRGGGKGGGRRWSRRGTNGIFLVGMAYYFIVCISVHLCYVISHSVMASYIF